jgi:hypothetical protein
MANQEFLYDLKLVHCPRFDSCAPAQFRPLGFAHLCRSRPRGSILAPSLGEGGSLIPLAPLLEQVDGGAAYLLVLSKFCVCLRRLSPIQSKGDGTT